MSRIVNIKELIALDENLRKSDLPVLYDLRNPNPYEGCSIPKTLFTLNNSRFTNSVVSCNVASRSAVYEEFYQKTLGKLPLKVRKHVAICGGSMFRLTKNVPSTSDIDIFLYGINSKKHATSIVKALCKHWSDKPSMQIVRTKNAVSIYEHQRWTPIMQVQGNISFNKIQIILRLYENINQILYGFDIQSSALAMTCDENDSFRVFGTELAMFGLATSHLPVDTGRRSESFPLRLEKYMQMGTVLIFPYMDPVKTAFEFANTGYSTEQHVGQKSARLALKDAKIILSRRIDELGYEGHIAKTTSIRYLDYDDDVLKGLDWYNFTLLMSASDGEKQPNLCLAIENYSQINNDINIKTYLRARKDAFNEELDEMLAGFQQVRFPDGWEGNGWDGWPMVKRRIDKLKRYRDFNVRDIKFPHIFTLEFRDIDPQSQWTTSFDPIIESAETWYGEFYTSQEQSEDSVITFMFTPEVLGQRTTHSREENGQRADVSMLQTVLSAEAGTVAEKLKVLKSQKFYERDHLWDDWETSVLQELIVMNSLRSTGSFTTDDMQAIIEFILEMNGKENAHIFVGFENDLLKVAGADRNTGLFRSVTKRQALLENVMPFVKIVHQVLQQTLKKQRNKELRLAATSKSFKWQVMCQAMSDFTKDELASQAKLFKIEMTEQDPSKRQICVALAKRTAELLNKWRGKCVNSDEMTLLLDSPVNMLPTELVWSQTVNGKSYCFKLEDMYKSILAGVRRTPRGVDVSPEDIKEIRERWEFLELVMTTFGLTRQSVGERAMESAANSTESSIETIEMDLATEIIDMIPYTPMSSYVFNHLRSDDITTIAQSFFNYIRRPQPVMRRLETLQKIKQIIVRQPVATGLYLREVLGEFIDENSDYVENIREQQLAEQRQRQEINAQRLARMRIE